MPKETITSESLPKPSYFINKVVQSFIDVHRKGPFTLKTIGKI